VSRKGAIDCAFRGTITPRGANAGDFAGWATVFYRIDSYDSIFAATCFNNTLERFLERGFVAGLNHDWDRPIGAPWKLAWIRRAASLSAPSWCRRRTRRKPGRCSPKRSRPAGR
jgi:hypothetical protein